MDLTLDRASLARALQVMGRIATARAGLAILQTVLLDAVPGQLRPRATDLELGVTMTLPAAVATPDRAAVPARLLGEYVAQLPAEPVRLVRDADGSPLVTTRGRFRARLAVADPDDFPAFPAANGEGALDLDAPAPCAALGRVVFAAARDEARPALTAVCFDGDAEGLTLTASDGFRLARTHLPSKPVVPRQWLVPARGAVELGRLLADTASVRLGPTTDDEGLQVVAGPTTLFTRLVAGAFPAVERVIPRE